MDAVLRALVDQMEELDSILEGLDESQWELPSACPGWTIADVVLHLAQTDEYAAASARGGFGEAVSRRGWVAPREGDSTVDDTAAILVESERGSSPPAVYERWGSASRDLVDALAACPPATRVQWVTGDLAARTLASTRLSECWIHARDVAHGLGVNLAPTDRLWHIARLAHRTLPYAFARAGRALAGPVTFRLTSPVDEDEVWTFGDEDPSGTTVIGRALDLCLIAGQRVDARDTAIVASGPDADQVLALVRTFA